MKAAHTPGPWTTTATTSEGTQTIAIVGTRFRGKARTSNKKATDTLAANALLVSAAPDLLEALEGLVHAVENEVEPHGRMVHGIRNAKAVIAKATGETP
jgi:hypothetical protein